MEMEFKDNSRRRTLVLVVGVLLALGAGAAAFMLSNQGTKETEAVFPTRDIVVAAAPINARDTIDATMVSVRPVPIDDTNATAITDSSLVVGRIAAIPITQFQPITANMLATNTGPGQVSILGPDETVAPDSPILRAVSLTVPADRAVGGLVDSGQRVDILATFPMAVSLPIDPTTGQPIDAETGTGLPYTEGTSTKLMWLDVKVISHTPETDQYIMRMDLQTAEEVAQAQNQGAQFTMVLRPEVDTRDVDRSDYGETNDTLLTRYNFRVPETIDGTTYPQPIAFPSPFPNEPYLSAAPFLLPSPSPDAALIGSEESPQP
jgi:Flp pilus assembly protein CpaB